MQSNLTGKVLEEWNFVNETMSYHGNTLNDRISDSLQSSADSSKEEEVRAICSRHRVKDTDTTATKLKALDTVGAIVTFPIVSERVNCHSVGVPPIA